jgi:tritrans,polycis-undecaprenyl-diphosphate synthase [geranylgeranyl-diphosphate specific]
VFHKVYKAEWNTKTEKMHIAIILDGNRRYAKKLGKFPWQGHSEGAKKVKEVMDWCGELGIKELTLYTFSIENFERDEKEKKELMRLFRLSMKDLEKDKRIDERKIRIRFIGRLGMFPGEIQESMRAIMEKTKGNGNYTVNFAMAYGGRAEIVDAAKAICEKVKSGLMDIGDIDEDTVTENLYLSSEPDMIIRPGGEQRVSNFLIWQGNYSEWYYTEKLWPEFTKDDMIMAIEELKRRERRFGR